MKMVFEAFVSIFLITVCVLLCASMIAADLDAVQARDAYSAYCNQLQDGNFAVPVQNACIEDAAERGYELTIESYKADNGNRSATVSLNYIYAIKMLGIRRGRVIRGYVS